MVMEVSYWWAEKLAAKGFWIGRAYSKVDNVSRYCVADSKTEAEERAKQMMWEMYLAR